MNLGRPLWRRALALFAVVVAVASADGSPALAHDGTGGAASDYRVTITGYSGDPSGIELRVVELGNRVELTRSGASEVIVLGYEGEPYLRLDAGGVWENVNSPAHYLNADRFAATRPPDGSEAQPIPSWIQMSTGDTARWHDHRAHWMSPIPPDSVAADPDVEQVVHTDRVDLVVDGRSVSAEMEITWLPKPERLIWLGAASATGAAVTAVLVLLAAARRLTPILAIDAALLATLGQGGSTGRLVTGGAILAVAAIAALVRNETLTVVAALAAGVLAATRLEVFEHELLAGWLPGAWQRIAVVGALGLALGVVAAALVRALGPTPTVSPDRTPARTADVAT